MKQLSRAAIEHLAEHFSADWRAGDGATDAWLTIGGVRIGVAIVSIADRIGNGAVKPRLRFDKGVLRLVGHLQTELSAAAPDGESALVTVTAPIRQVSKTGAALVETIRPRLKRRPARSDVQDLICGNQIRFRIVRAGAAHAAKIIGFVHNPHPGADLALLDRAEALLTGLAEAAERRAPAKFGGDRWLVFSGTSGADDPSNWRRIYARLSVQGNFSKVLMLFGDGKVETLSS
jgi:hypothetical protein